MFPLLHGDVAVYRRAKELVERQRANAKPGEMPTGVRKTGAQDGI